MRSMYFIKIVVLTSAWCQAWDLNKVQVYGPNICELFCHKKSRCATHQFDSIQMMCRLMFSTSGLNMSGNVLSQLDIILYDSKDECKSQKDKIVSRHPVIRGRKTSYYRQKVETSVEKNRLICPPARVRSLLGASANGNLARVKRLLSRGLVEVNCRGPKGRTAVMKAAGWALDKMFDCLVQQRCDLSAVDDQNCTVLQVACMGGSKYIVKKLLDDHAFDIESRRYLGKSPLMLAFEYNNMELFKFLLERWADVNTVDDKNNNILHVACEDVSISIMKVEFILSQNIIDIGSRGQNGRTPLMIAVENGRQQLAKSLIDRGADVNTVGDMNNNILHAACRGGNVKMVKYILSLRLTEIDCRGHLGRTPLMFAVESDHTPVVQLLRGRGADFKAKDDNGLTVLHIASQARQLDMIKYLVTFEELRGVEKMKTKEGDTPLQLAVKNDHLDVVSFFKSLE